MGSWAQREFIRADLGDARRTERLIRIAEHLMTATEGALPFAAGSPADAKALYRFCDNHKVRPLDVLGAHRMKIAERAQGQNVVLVAQDTTELDYSWNKPAAKNLGYLRSTHQRGMLVHTLLAMSEDGVPLGVLDQWAWDRKEEEPQLKKSHDQLPTAEKESQRWIDGMQSAGCYLPSARQVVVIGDRESDLYDLFTAPREPNVELLVRVRDKRRHVRREAPPHSPTKTSRRVEHQGAISIQTAINETPVGATITLELPRADDRPSRQATFELRWTRLYVCRPANHPGEAPAEGLWLWFLEAREVNPPPGQTAVVWLLASTLPIPTSAVAAQLVRWYTYRWRGERFHYVLKSGCHIEEHRLETFARLERLLTIYSVVAWQILWLTYQVRQAPEQSCETVLERDEWVVLHQVTRRRSALPSRAPPLSTVIQQLGQLGGHQGRRRDGPPGVKTLWRGYRRLLDYVRGYRLSHYSTLK